MQGTFSDALLISHIGLLDNALSAIVNAKATAEAILNAPPQLIPKTYASILPQKERYRPLPHLSQARIGLLAFIDEHFKQAFTHGELKEKTIETKFIEGNCRALTNILRKEGKLFQVVFNNSKKFCFYVLPEWIVENERGPQLIKEYYPDKLPNRITSAVVLKGL